jgi:cytochrome c-type biogenesis protein
MNLSDVANLNIPILSAFLLGLMACLGPCTMATNIAALAYVSRNIKNRKAALLTGSLYTLGRMITYTVIGVLIISLGLEIPAVSIFLQNTMEKAFGPLFIFVGILMLFIDRIRFGSGSGKITAIGNKIASWGVIGGLPLGALFALGFCPYSAMLFFAILIPISIKVSEGIALPSLFAIGTGLPVLVFGTLITLGVAGLSKWLNAISRADKIIRIVVSVVFIGVGIYYLYLWLQTPV